MEKDKRGEALEDIGEFVIQSILDSVGSGKSPVQNGSYKKSLSKGYKKIKKKLSSSSIANMELTGQMLDELDFKIDKQKMSIEVGFLEDASQLAKDKADNHNKFSAKAKKTKLPARQFIPRKNEKFKKSIMKEITQIADEYASENNEET